MADRYDPKLSLRPVGDRKAADPRRTQGVQDDPLAELAKLVSGRSTPSSQARARSAPPTVSEPPPQRGDGFGDLETELLNDLQASFAAVRETLTQAVAPPVAAPPVAAPPAPTPPAPQPPTARSEPAKPSISLRPEAEPHEADLFEDILPAHLAQRLAPAPPAPAAPLQPARATAPGRVEGAALPQPANDPVAREKMPARTDGFPAREPESGSDFSYRTRTLEAPAQGGQPSGVSPSRGRSRWEKPEAAKSTSVVSRFAPPRAVAVTPAAPPPSRGDENEFDALSELVGGDDDIEDDFPLEGFGELEPEEDEEAHPFPEGDLASMMEPRRSRTPLLIAGVIGLVLVGGFAVAMFRPTGGETGTPSIIVADGEPTRITPETETAAASDEQSKLIYDRVNSGEGGTETTLLASEDEGIAPVGTDTAADNPITRVIIPAGPGIDDPAMQEGLSLDGQPSTLPEPNAPQVAAADPIEAIGPRRVRTVVVKPDGTIVESLATDASEGAPETGAAEAAAAMAEPVVQPPVETNQRPVLEPPAPAPVTDDTAAIAGTGPNGELAITPVPEIGGSGEVAAAPEPAPQTAPAPEPAPVAVAPEPAPQPAPPPAVTAAVQPEAPIELNQAPPPPSGGMLVQVSSQRSEDAARATFRDLQARYPNILGSYEVNIQRADIPDRGTFFRVRVGPFSASDAQRLCNDLKSAGGDCILAQR
jgi:hypothetical protein